MVIFQFEFGLPQQVSFPSVKIVTLPLLQTPAQDHSKMDICSGILSLSVCGQQKLTILVMLYSLNGQHAAVSLSKKCYITLTASVTKICADLDLYPLYVSHDLLCTLIVDVLATKYLLKKTE